ncbi:probable salivary secreted peptide [Vespa velutina]|uniref:probable salivary secreted peptide n=1 Tax=Vespa velutina TaxID=202808 RepID=UPI001FB3BC6B|nr:probable salivary secreted peptide [Vespa velutina]
MHAQNLLMVIVVAIAVVVIAGVESDYVPRAHLEEYAAKSHNLTIGYRKPGDRRVHTQNIVKKSSWMRIVTAEVSINTSSIINMVGVYDQKTDGTGAFPSVLKGGPGNRNVTLRFKSQRGHGINFVVEVYAR